MFLSKLLHRDRFLFRHVVLEALTILLQDMLDLSDRNYREEFGEQEEAGKEQSESSQVKSDFPDCRSIVCTPATWNIITINRSYNDHKTFEPHTYVNNDTHEEREQ